MHVIDWGQTRDIAKHPEMYRELNPFLPAYPRMGQVNQHFVISGLVIAGLAHFIPSWRKTLLSVYVVGGGANVLRNSIKVGVRVNF